MKLMKNVLANHGKYCLKMNLVVWHRVIPKLDEVNSVFVFAKKSTFNVHLWTVSRIEALRDANFDLQNSLSFLYVISSDCSGLWTNIVVTPISLEIKFQSLSIVLLMSSLLFYSIRVLNIIDTHVNYQKVYDECEFILSQKCYNSSDQLKF